MARAHGNRRIVLPPVAAPRAARSVTPRVRSPFDDPTYCPEIMGEQRSRLNTAWRNMIGHLVALGEHEHARELIAEARPPAAEIPEDAHLPWNERRRRCGYCGAVIRGPAFFSHRARCGSAASAPRPAC